MSFGQFLAILRARWMLAFTVFATIVAAAVLLSLALPKQYTASASVVVDFKPDPLTQFMYSGMMSPTLMATQVDIIRSERVAQRVVRLLKLDQNPQVRAQWQEETGGQGSLEVWLGTLFQRQMDIVPSRESSVLSITYKAPDPRFAAAMANAFVQSYIETALELRTNPARQFTTFFDTRAKEARDAVETAQNKLSEFQKAKGIIASDERYDVENQRLNELSSQFTQAQALTAESLSRERQAQSAFADRLPDVLANPLVAQLKADVARGEAQLQQLTTRLGDAHPQVQESRANLAEIRSRLAIETRRATGSVGVTNTINRQREGSIKRELDEQRAKVLQMKQVRDEGVVLLRDVENTQKTYDTIVQRFTQTSLESQATQSNVNLLTQATPPLEPSSPRVLLNTLIALFIGTLLALGAALLREFNDRRVRTLEDAVAALGLPLLGVLPKPGSRLALSGRTQAMSQRLLAPLPQPSRLA